MLKNIVERDRPHIKIWRMRVACWIPKSTNTRSDCVIYIAFPLQQWLHERASMLRYTYVTSHLMSLSSTPFKKDNDLTFLKLCNICFQIICRSN